jgi:hypothetical protein
LRVLGKRLSLDPAEALVGGVFGFGVDEGEIGRVGDLFEEPILAVVALADGVGNVVWEEQGVAKVPTPKPVVGPVAFEELVAGAVGIADLPELPAVPDGLPDKLAEVDGLAG